MVVSSWPPSLPTSQGVQQVFDASETFGRKVAVIGRSMEQNSRIATELGYLQVTPKTKLIPKGRIKDIPDDQLTIAHDRRPG